MRPTFEWEGTAFQAPRTAGDVFTLFVDLVGRDDLDEATRLVYIAGWCAQWTDEWADELIERHQARVLDLAIEMARRAGLSKAFRGELTSYLDIGTGADEYDAAREKASCECPKCAGAVDEYDGCKFNGVTDRAKLAAEWAHLAENPLLWDKPLSLLHLSMAVASSKSRGQAAIYQKSDREREEREAAKRIRQKHGHKW